MDLRLKIQGQVIDTFDDETIILNRSIQDVRDISKLFSDYVQRFNVPASESNNKIFTYFYNLDVTGSFDQHTKASASLEFKGIELLIGNIELLKAQVKTQRGLSYEIVFYGNIKSLDTVSKEDTLQDIDFTTLDHELTYASITDSWDLNLRSGDVVYPLWDSGRNWLWSNGIQTSPNNINVANYAVNGQDIYGGINLVELKPSIRLKKMVELIFSHYGYTLNSNWLSLEDTEKIYVHLNRIAGNVRDEEGGTNANMSVLRDTSQSFGFNVDTPIEFSSELYDVANSFTLPSTYTAQYTGTHRFKIDAIVNATSPGAGAVWKILFYVNGSQLLSPVLSSQNYNSVSPISNTVTINLAQNDTLIFYVNSTATTGNALDYCKITKTGGTQTLFGQVINVNKRMPLVKVSDFINGFLKTFNLVLEPVDEFSFNLEPVDDWYEGGKFVSYDDLIDVTTEDILKVPVYKNVHLKHKDGTDVGSTAYKRYADRQFGATMYAPNVDFGVDELKIETIFNIPVPQVLNELSVLGNPTGLNTGIHLQKFIDDTGKPIAPNLTLAYFNGKQGCSGYYLQNGVDANDVPQYGLTNEYGHFSIFSEFIPTTDSNTLAFSLERPLTTSATPVNTLFQKYYNNYIQRIYNREAKILKCEAVIPMGTLLNFKLNDKIIYNGQQFTVNNLSYDFLKERATLELLTYDLDIPFQGIVSVDPGDDDVTFLLAPTNRDVASYGLLPNAADDKYFLQPYTDDVNDEINNVNLVFSQTEPSTEIEGWDGISGGTFTIRIVSNEYQVRLLTASTYTLPELDLLLDKSRYVNFKNASNGEATLQCSGSDTIDGQESYALSQNENLKVELLLTNEFSIT